MDLITAVLAITTLFVVIDLGVMIAQRTQRNDPQHHAGRTAHE